MPRGFGLRQPSAALETTKAPAAVAPERRFGAPRRRKGRRTPGRYRAVRSPEAAGSWAGARAFTLNDLLALIVVAIVIVLVALLLPALAKAKARSSRINCVNMLKQISLAFRIWEGDNNDRFPMMVSTNEGGSMEWVGGPNAWRHFLVMSNELCTPKILFCPEETDSARKVATVFGPVPHGVAGQVSFTGNSNLSYFVGVDAASTNASMILAGDRNITNGTPVKDGMLLLTTNEPAGWNEQIHKEGRRVWGNVALADGSVQSLETPQLHDAIRATGVATNRLALP